MPSIRTPRRPTRPRTRRLVAGSIAVGLAVAGLAVANGQSAGAATPAAQSVGRFLDGSVGGNPIQQLADLADARAVAPGSQSAQNPLDVTLLNSLKVPLTGALQLPSLAGITLGAANQVAVARTSGFSYGASGAVANSGGVSIGGDNGAYPSDASVDLSAAALGGGTIPIPGGTPADALGGVTLRVGAVSALARTPAGPGTASTNYDIAGLKLELGSPAVAALLGTLSRALDAGPLTTALQNLLGGALPPGCALRSGVLGTSLKVAGGAVVIDATTGSITIDVAALLRTLGADLNHLPANTDLLDYVLRYISGGGLAAGIGKVLNSALQPLIDQYQACRTALEATVPAGQVLTSLIDTLLQGKDKLTSALNGLLGSASAVSGTGNPLAPLATGLGKVLAIGVNVQPIGPKGTFTSTLRATPDQATPVVAGQTVVRAIEIDLLGGQAALALANAAVGPSAAAASPTPAVTSPSHAVEATDVPTKINAGQVTGGSPTVPLVLVAVGLVMAAGGAVTWRLRGHHAR